MAREYTLHRMPQTLESRCPMCGAVFTYGEGEVKGAQIDLPEHMRAKGDRETCPGSGFTAKLYYQARPVRPTQPQDIPKDGDLFPFGKYQGIEFGKVPADYLDWLIGQSWIGRWPKVVAYVEANRAVIDKDL